MEYATGQQIYEVITPAAETPISVTDLKLYAKINGTAEDALLAQIIAGVTLEAERYTKREFVTRTYRTYRDQLGDFGEQPAYVSAPPMRYRNWRGREPIVLRRSPLLAISSIKYYLSGVLTTISSADYQIVKKPAFSFVIPVGDSVWPSVDIRLHGVVIEFTAGYGAASAVPADIKNALLAHATQVYQNRGDCDSGGSCACNFAPSVALMVYQQYRIMDFVG